MILSSQLFALTAEKQNYTSIPYLLLIYCSGKNLPDSGSDHEGSNLSHHEADPGFQSRDEGSPDNLSRYYRKMSLVIPCS